MTTEKNELTGDWAAVAKLLSSLPKVLHDGAALGIAQAARIVEAALVMHIQKQDLPWKKLSKPYAAYKRRKKLSNQIWIATSTTMQSITTLMNMQEPSAFVGFLRNGPKVEGKPVVEIAKIMEYGSAARNIPARPLVRPTMQQTTAPVKEQIQKAIGAALDRAIQGAGRGR